MSETFKQLAEDFRTISRLPVPEPDLLGRLESLEARAARCCGEVVDSIPWLAEVWKPIQSVPFEDPRVDIERWGMVWSMVKLSARRHFPERISAQSPSSLATFKALEGTGSMSVSTGDDWRHRAGTDAELCDLLAETVGKPGVPDGPSAATPSHNAVTPSIDRHDAAILRELSSGRLYLPDLAERLTEQDRQSNLRLIHSRKEIGERVQALCTAGYAIRPGRGRSGIEITEAGQAALSKFVKENR